MAAPASRDGVRGPSVSVKTTSRASGRAPSANQRRSSAGSPALAASTPPMPIASSRAPSARPTTRAGRRDAPGPVHERTNRGGASISPAPKAIRVALTAVPTVRGSMDGVSPGAGPRKRAVRSGRYVRGRGEADRVSQLRLDLPAAHALRGAGGRLRAGRPALHGLHDRAPSALHAQGDGGARPLRGGVPRRDQRRLRAL